MSPLVARAARVSTPAIEARLGAELGRLINVSATGALVRTAMSVVAGHQCRLVLNLAEEPATCWVRVVRSDALPVEMAGAVSRLRQYQVAVQFTELSGPARHAVATLCGPALTQRE
jgi:hypothetical protein